MKDIRFPNLGIHLHNVGDSFSLFGIEIRVYGLLIAIGFFVATTSLATSFFFAII